MVAGRFFTRKFSAFMVKTPQKRIEVVAGLIFHDRRVLACQRRGGAAHPLKWEFPGGKVEIGEAENDALRRELEEELGIQAQGMKQVYQYQHAYPKGPKVSLKFFNVSSYRGKLENRVFQNILWANLADLKRLDFLAGDRPLIDRLVTDGGAALLGHRLLS
jgi:8-oxo-dGTP diphosphatase